MPLGVLPRTMSPSMNNFWASCAADILATDMFANPTTIKDNAITGNFRVSISGASLNSSCCVAAFEHPGVICLIAWTATTSVRAACGVLTTLVVADLTNGTGRFNLAQGSSVRCPNIDDRDSRPKFRLYGRSAERDRGGLPIRRGRFGVHAGDQTVNSSEGAWNSSARTWCSVVPPHDAQEPVRNIDATTDAVSGGTTAR